MILKSSAPVETKISRALIVDKIAELLYTLRVIPPNSTVRDIDFKDTDKKLWTISVSIRKEKEVLVSKHNGFKKTKS